MFVVYTFSALMGVIFALLPRLGLVPQPVDAAGSTDDPEPGRAPIWAVGLLGFGLMGFTLELAGRDFWPTLTSALFAGLPAGLLAAWIGGRIARR